MAWTVGISYVVYLVHVGLVVVVVVGFFGGALHIILKTTCLIVYVRNYAHVMLLFYVSFFVMCLQSKGNLLACKVGHVSYLQLDRYVDR